MNCRACGAPVLDKNLLCRECVAGVSHRAVLALQPGFLPMAIDGRVDLRLWRRTGQREWHVEMLGGYGGQAFCGVLFDNSKKKREWAHRQKAYSKLDVENDLCAACRAMLASKAAAIATEAK